jgi:uncharacterized protein (TIGR03083 family)
LNKDQLTALIRAAHEALDGELSGLTYEQIIRSSTIGEWSVKDIVAHLADWERRFVADVEGLMEGREPEHAEMWTGDFQPANEEIYTANKDRPLAEIRAEAAAARDAILALVKPILDDSRFDLGRFPYATLSVRTSWIYGNGAGHVLLHRDGIAAWRNANS